MATREQICRYLEKMAAQPSYAAPLPTDVKPTTAPIANHYTPTLGQRNTFGQPGGYSAGGGGGNAIFQGAQRFQNKVITPAVNRLSNAAEAQGQAVNQTFGMDWSKGGIQSPPPGTPRFPRNIITPVVNKLQGVLPARSKGVNGNAGWDWANAQ